MVMYWKSTNQSNGEVLSKQTAYIMNDMLRGVVEQGTGRRANIGRPAAGKTGYSPKLY